jgi:hypothetical protein
MAMSEGAKVAAAQLWRSREHERPLRAGLRGLDYGAW